MRTVLAILNADFNILQVLVSELEEYQVGSAPKLATAPRFCCLRTPGRKTCITRVCF